MNSLPLMTHSTCNRPALRLEMALICGFHLIACSLAQGELRGRWTGDGNTLDTAGTNHATLMNGATYAAGKVNQAFSLDGSNDYVALPDTTSLLISNSAGTIAAWVYPTVLGGNDVIAVFGSGAIGQGIGLGIFNYVRIYHHTTAYDWQSATPVTANAWTFLAYTWNATMEAIYTNGVLSQTRPRGTFIYVPGQARIGHGSWGDAANNFPGRIDQVMIFTEALNACELAVLARTQPAHVSAIQHSGSALSLSLTNLIEGRDYSVQRTADLPGGTWTNVVDFVARGDSTNWTDVAAPPDRAFYRVEEK